MIADSVSTSGGIRIDTVPPGWTDLNLLLAGLLADCSATSIRCEPIPPAEGSQEEWWLLLRWLMSPLRQGPGSGRYVHVRCEDVVGSREHRYRLSVRCSDTTGVVRAFAFANPQLANIATRLGIQLRQPTAADAHCLFILEYPGKNTLHAHH